MGGRRRPGGPSPTAATGELERAVAWWRAVLSVPFTSYVQTRDELARTTTAAGEPSRGPARERIESLQPGDLVVTGVTVACEVASADRQALLEHQDLPWLTVAGFTIPPTAEPRWVGLVPVTFILADPLTPAEQARLSTRQAHCLAEFDARVHACRPTLLRLTAAGGDPTYVLSVLVRFAAKRGTTFPTKPAVRLEASDFEQVMTHRPGEHPLAWHTTRSPVLPSRLEARRRISPTAGPLSIFSSMGPRLFRSMGPPGPGPSRDGVPGLTRAGGGRPQDGCTSGPRAAQLLSPPVAGVGVRRRRASAPRRARVGRRAIARYPPSGRVFWAWPRRRHHPEAAPFRGNAGVFRVGLSRVR